MNLPNRQSVRLKHYDYATPNWYYVTICTQNRRSLFGKIVGGEMVLNNVGNTLGHIIRYFKAKSSRLTRRKLWQRNYAACPERMRRKHVIRNQKSLNKIQNYIKINPQIWDRDRNNPNYKGGVSRPQNP